MGVVDDKATARTADGIGMGKLVEFRRQPEKWVLTKVDVG